MDTTAFRVAYRRLTESQYRNSIADVFGPDVKVNARFEPEQREDGLQAVGNSRLSITTSGLEQYFSVARSIADQVLDEDNRARSTGCASGDSPTAAETCAAAFIRERGRRLFRRPLSASESAEAIEIWRKAYGSSGDFYKGLKLSLVSLLMKPEFLFRVESAEPDPVSKDTYRLDGWTKASRLSFLLWDTSPDEELLEAARSGSIHTPDGLARQLDRMLASPRLEAGVRAFFVDMLHFEAFETLTKDVATYPKFSQALADSAREETLRFLIDQLVTRGGDYRDIFTARDTVMNRTLAAAYDVPYPSKDPWTAVTFPEDSDRSGILTQVTFLSLFSHPGRSSPTIRGVKLHEIFLCLKTPDPPPDVDFSKVQATEKGTVRTRLIDHMTNPGCSTCHRISDPVGLALERFDGMGQHRTTENGQPIDVSADIGDKKYDGARGIGQYLHDSPLVPACLVRNVHYYGQGRPVDYREQAFLAQQTQAFAERGYRLRDLYRSLVASPEFFNVVKPPEPELQKAAKGAAQ